jgi:uncharacterized damage-inducible protein DinB
MSLQKLISNYAAYNQWANERIVSWLQPLDEGLLYQVTPSSYVSIDYTVQHILRAQNFWFNFVVGNDVSQFNWSVREGEVQKILHELNQSSAQMFTRYSAFSETELIEPLQLSMPWAKNTLNRYEYIMHVINHSTYHRGQVITMARAVGIVEGVPNTDYNMFNIQKL